MELELRTDISEQFPFLVAATLNAKEPMIVLQLGSTRRHINQKFIY